MNRTPSSSLQSGNTEFPVIKNLSFSFWWSEAVRSARSISKMKTLIYQHSDAEYLAKKRSLIKHQILWLTNALEFYKKLLEKYLKYYSIVLFWVKVINDFLLCEVTINAKLGEKPKKTPRRNLSAEYKNYQVLLDYIFIEGKLMKLPENESKDTKDLSQCIATFFNMRRDDTFLRDFIEESSYTKSINCIIFNMRFLSALESRICKGIDELIGLSEFIMNPDARNLLVKLKVFAYEEFSVPLKVFRFDGGKVIYDIKQYDERNCVAELEKEIDNLEKAFNDKKNKNNTFNRFFGLFCGGKKLETSDFIKETNHIKDMIKMVENESNNQKDCLAQVSSSGKLVKHLNSLLKYLNKLLEIVEKEKSYCECVKKRSSLGKSLDSQTSEEIYVCMNDRTHRRM